MERRHGDALLNGKHGHRSHGYCRRPESLSNLSGMVAALGCQNPLSSGLLSVLISEQKTQKKFNWCPVVPS